MTNFRIDFQVRDYECDIVKIVNNANYFHYFEHARHEYLKAIGLNFFDLSNKDIFLVLVRAEIEYKKALKSGDQFYVTVKMEQISRLKFCFKQEIYLLPDENLVTTGLFIGTAISAKTNKPIELKICYNKFDL